MIGNPVADMFKTFGNADSERLAMYIKILSCFPKPLVEKACQKAILECKFLPSVAEIVQSIKSLIGELDESKRIKTWAEAWHEIENAMHKYGCTGKTPKFSTKEIDMAIKMIGGLDVLACCPVNNFNTIRAQTRDIYKTVCARESELQINAFVLGIDKTQIEAPKQDKKFLLTNDGQIIF